MIFFYFLFNLDIYYLLTLKNNFFNNFYLLIFFISYISQRGQEMIMRNGGNETI